MASEKMGMRSNYNFFADKALSKVTESSVRATELPKVDSLKEATAKAAAVRPSPSNTQGFEILDGLRKNLYQAIQNTPAPSNQPAVVTETVKSPSFGF